MEPIFQIFCAQILKFGQTHVSSNAILFLSNWSRRFPLFPIEPLGHLSCWSLEAIGQNRSVAIWIAASNAGIKSSRDATWRRQVVMQNSSWHGKKLASNWSEGKNKTKFLGCNSVHQWLAFDSVCIHSENRKFVHQYNQLLILLINKNHQQLIQSIHVITFLKTNIVPENWCLEEDPASLKTGHLGKKPNSWMTELFPDLLHPSQVLGPMNAIEASTPILEKTSPQRVGPRGFKRHTTARRSW